MTLIRGFASRRARAAGDRSPTSAFHGGLLLTGILCFQGLLIGIALLRYDQDRLRALWHALSLTEFGQQDTVWFALALAVIVYLRLAMSRPAGRYLPGWLARRWPTEPKPLRHVALIALAVLGFAVAGTFLFHHGYSFVIDEYLAEQQSEIFAGGELLATLPKPWREYHAAILHDFAHYDPATGLWASGYRPLFAAIRAGFSLVGLASLTNAILTALSIVLVALVAQRLWPGRRDVAIVAAVLLATSPQVLFTGMSGFAWSAHLCLNLLWVWLFLRGDKAGHMLAALVGVAAVGLHQIHVHAFFVLPFMLGLLGSRRFGLAGFYAAVYAAGHLAWLLWYDVSLALTAPAVTAGVAAAGSTGFEYLSRGLGRVTVLDPVGLGLMGLNFFRLLAWQNLILLPLVLVALRHWRSLDPALRLLTWGIALSLIPYVLVMPNQMHGWGYRYLHGLLGNLVLLGTYGYVRLSADRGQAAAALHRAFVIAAAAMVVLALPLRAVQVDRLVGPLARADRYVQSQEAE
ncbi:MAG: hypothetical protein HKM95_02440, partial [Inquilinus sp.]|nr:hypothetical protein [Inquilinus sp.]